MWDVNDCVCRSWFNDGYSVWSELCGMWTHLSLRRVVLVHFRLIWTMWDVNHLQFNFRTIAILVWSELCGMWTSLLEAMWEFLFRFDLNYVGCELNKPPFRKTRLQFVWSELCGMWTNRDNTSLLFPLRVWSELCGMWTIRRESLIRKMLSSVWSELCGMWTQNNGNLNERFWSRLIWTMWDVNVTETPVGGMVPVFDLNYVGCEHACGIS